MIVCKVCGNRNNDQEEFCTSCGRYLAWSGEHVDVAPEAEPDLVIADAVPEAQPEGFWRRLGTRLHLVRPRSRPAPAGQREPAFEHDEGVRVIGALPPTAAGRLSAAPSAALPAGSAEDDAAGLGVLVVVPEVVGAGAGGPGTPGVDTTAPLALVGNGDGSRSTKPRRPGEPGSTLPVLPPLPGREPPPSERATVLRRPTEVVDKPQRARRSRTGAAPGLPQLPATPSPGDVFCPHCGQFNSPTRVYCRRCGTELGTRQVAAEEIAYEPLTWWQRHLHHDVRVVTAGQRPGRWGKIVSGAGSQGRGLRIVERAGALLIGVSLVLTFIGPYGNSMRGWYTNTWHAIYNYINAREVGVAATSASATSSAPGHPAWNAVDQNSATWWQSKTAPVPKPPAKKPAASHPAHAAGAGAAPTPTTSLAGTATTAAHGTAGAAPKPKPKPRSKTAAAKGKPATTVHHVPPPKPLPPGVGQVLTVNFATPTNLNRIAWLSGVSGTVVSFEAIGRPEKVEIIGPGARTTTETLQDMQTLQTFKFVASNVSTLRFKILSVYPGTVRAVAITEIEFFERQ